jgi:uncharacterized surface protein with fasciclin (FAS1) repeats
MKRVRTSAICAAMSLALVAGTAFSLTAFAKTVSVEGAPMYRSKNIVENAVHSRDHTTLVAAVKAAGLVDTLEGPAPFTVFAPVNRAFSKLPKGTVENLLKPENKDILAAVLTYHVVAGEHSAAQVAQEVKAGGGRAMKTVQGKPLTVVEAESRLEVIGAKGDRSMITIADVNQSNGVIHVIDTVLLPN